MPSNQQINVEKKTPITTTLKKLFLKVYADLSVKRDINILLLGETHVGRSTFINAFANYLLNDTLEQAVNDEIQVLIPCSFSFTDSKTFDERKIVYGEEDEYEGMGNCGTTSTRKCRSFVFTIGDRLLRLIDTPPVGDTRGFEQDIRNFDEIMSYIAQYNYLNGIFIFLEPNEERLHVGLRYCIAELFGHLPKSAIANIMFVFTNARVTLFRLGSPGTFHELFDQYQQDYSIQGPFTKENTFLVDNEAFRYLAVHHNGIQLDRNITDGCTTSWNHNVKEYVRLIAHVTSRPAHNVHDTVSLNEVQRLISILAHLIFQATQYIEQAIQLAAEYKKSISRNSQNFSQNDVQILFLDHPRLVCTNSKCTGFTNVNGLQMIEYKSICYDRCYFIGNTIGDKNHPTIKTCAVMNQEKGTVFKLFSNRHMELHTTSITTSLCFLELRFRKLR